MAYLFQRGRVFYLKHYVGGKQKEISLRTDNRQIAKERQRRFESAQVSGFGNPLPTRTTIAQVLKAYAEHIRTVKTPKSAQNEVYYLRELFGAVTPTLSALPAHPTASVISSSNAGAVWSAFCTLPSNSVTSLPITRASSPCHRNPIIWPLKPVQKTRRYVSQHRFRPSEAEVLYPWTKTR
jgi:hypothetical protein